MNHDQELEIQSLLLSYSPIQFPMHNICTIRVFDF